MANLGGRGHNRTSAENALFQSRRRIAANIRDHTKAYGWRFELRVTRALAEQVQAAEPSWLELVREGSTGSGSSSPRAGDPARLVLRVNRDAFFVLKAHEFIRFLDKNIDKYLRLMDYIVALYRKTASTRHSELHHSAR